MMKVHKTVRLVAGTVLIAAFSVSPFVTLPLLALSALGEIEIIGRGFLTAGLLSPVVVALALFPFLCYAGWVDKKSAEIARSRIDARI